MNAFLDVPEKVRLISVGGTRACGLLLGVMSMCFDMVKSVEPAFVQGYQKGMLEARFNNVPKQFLKCPMDGGRWDSNQHSYRLTTVLKAIINMFL